MKIKKNQSTLYYVDLGSRSIATEEKQERAKIKRRVMPHNNTILAFPYPKSYKVSRKIWVGMQISEDHSLEYYVTFSHSCLAWTHFRIYNLDDQEFSDLISVLTAKYGIGAVSVFEATEHCRFTTYHQEWTLDDLSTIGE